MWATAAQASDRRFLVSFRAAAVKNDDGVWAVESCWQRTNSQQGLSVTADYGFNQTASLQIERSRKHDRTTGDKAHACEAHACESELKHLFKRIGRDGLG